MATARESSSRNSRWPARIVVLAGVLFPLLVVGGVLAPQVISLMAEVEVASAEPEPEAETVLDFSRPMPGKPPLLLPRDYEAGFVPELLDLQNLFTGANQTPDQMSKEYSRLLGFPRSHGDVIVMDDVDREIKDVIFKDPVMVGAETAYPRPNPALLPIPEPRPLGDGLRFDDPQATGEGPVFPIPEPGTGVLLASGLAILAFRHRQR
ncbi:MAG: PEP-CTERM sorting domain-containing protein [Deltaproteobacteria bacterium]|nr:PEP-CTERM sorting domain-containing protein [Deltaproteobacteria bacterium]